MANISFVVATLIGSVGGSYVAENMGITGFWILVSCTIPGIFFAFFLREVPTGLSLKFSQYKEAVGDILQKLGVPIIVTAGLWAVITALAQIFVEVSVEHFGKSFTDASLVLVWATLGGIIGNIWSMQFQEKRFLYYRISLALLGLIILASTGLIDLIIYLESPIFLALLAVTIGLVFGIAVNLMDGYYFLKLETSKYKSIGAAVYGLVASVAILGLMQGILSVKYIEIHLPFLLCSLCVGGLYYVSRKLR